HRLRVAQPERDFIAANEAAICKYMKMITPGKLLDSLRLNIHEVTVAPEVADRARLAIERMIAIGRASTMDGLGDIKLDDNGLVPAIVQDAGTGGIVMRAWMTGGRLS